MLFAYDSGPAINVNIEQPSQQTRWLSNPAIKWIRRHLKVSDKLRGERFFLTKEDAGKPVRFATRLFLVLILVEITDLIFAVDSIPAIFAILGLRAMYFLLIDLHKIPMAVSLGVVAAIIGTSIILSLKKTPANGDQQDDPQRPNLKIGP